MMEEHIITGLMVSSPMALALWALRKYFVSQSEETRLIILEEIRNRCNGKHQVLKNGMKNDLEHQRDIIQLQVKQGYVDIKQNTEAIVESQKRLEKLTRKVDLLIHEIQRNGIKVGDNGPDDTIKNVPLRKKR